jgi:hypothetical protein
VEKLSQLRVLFLSNNRIKDWSEVERLAAAEQLEDLLLVGNPLYNEYRDSNTTPEYRVEVCAAQPSGGSKGRPACRHDAAWGTHGWQLKGSFLARAPACMCHARRC